MFLKNKITGSIGEYFLPQGEEYIELTEDEVLDLKLQKAKKEKIAEIKRLREINLNSPVPKLESLLTLQIRGKDEKFFIKSEDVARLAAIINSGVIKRNYTSIDNKRISLSDKQIRSLLNHYLVRDEQEHDLCRARIEEIEALISIDEVEKYDINSIPK